MEETQMRVGNSPGKEINKKAEQQGIVSHFVREAGQREEEGRLCVAYKNAGKQELQKYLLPDTHTPIFLG